MIYNVIWSKFSETQLDEIFEFYKEKSKSIIVARKIISKLLLAPNRLINNPRLGPVELSLENRKIKYHYIIESNYKIIYSVDDINFQIKISDIFDTHQDPSKVTREK